MRLVRGRRVHDNQDSFFFNHTQITHIPPSSLPLLPSALAVMLTGGDAALAEKKMAAAKETQIKKAAETKRLAAECRRLGGITPVQYRAIISPGHWKSWRHRDFVAAWRPPAGQTLQGWVEGKGVVAVKPEAEGEGTAAGGEEERAAVAAAGGGAATSTLGVGGNDEEEEEGGDSSGGEEGEGDSTDI